ARSPRRTRVTVTLTRRSRLTFSSCSGFCATHPIALTIAWPSAGFGVAAIPPPPPPVGGEMLRPTLKATTLGFAAMPRTAGSSAVTLLSTRNVNSKLLSAITCPGQDDGSLALSSQTGDPSRWLTYRPTTSDVRASGAMTCHADDGDFSFAFIANQNLRSVA